MNSTSGNAIEAQNLVKSYDGKRNAVDDITFSVRKGEIYGLLGKNGAGKSTTIKILTTLIDPTSGSVNVLGYSPQKHPLQIKKRIGVVQQAESFDFTTVENNLKVYATLWEIPREEAKSRTEELLELFELTDVRKTRAFELSGGQKKKLQVARELMHDMEVLFLDEPTANLDPEASKVIRDVILKLKGEGRTIFLNTHNLDEAQRICDRIGILKTKLIAVDTPKNLENAFPRKVTAIVLTSVNDRILNAVKSMNPKKLTVEGNTIHIEMADPDRETPAIVGAISGAGGQVKSVNEEGASLEDVYLSIVRREQN